MNFHCKRLDFLFKVSLHFLLPISSNRYPPSFCLCYCLICNSCTTVNELLGTSYVLRFFVFLFAKSCSLCGQGQHVVKGGNMLSFFLPAKGGGLPLPPTPVRAPLSLYLGPLHAPPLWCGRRRWGGWGTVWWRWGGGEGPAEHQDARHAGGRTPRQEETARAIRRINAPPPLPPSSFYPTFPLYWWWLSQSILAPNQWKICMAGIVSYMISNAMLLWCRKLKES